MAETTGLTYGVINTKHPDYLAEYWAVCRALYAGGRRLLNDPEILRRVFVKNPAECEEVYLERCQRAYYINYAGSIVDKIIAELFKETPYMTAEPEANPWFANWFKDVSPPGGRKLEMSALLKKTTRTALQCKRGWALLEVPKVAPDLRPSNLLEQEKIGGLNVYAVPVEPECVYDWEQDDTGELEWVLIASRKSKRDGLTSKREKIVEQFVHYTKTEATTYEIGYTRDKPPGENDVVPMVDRVPHSFGRVPVVMLELPDGLWVMERLESLARAHMNKENALSWGEYKSLLQHLIVFLEDGGAASDPNRAENQTWGQGYAVKMRGNDRVEYVGPNTASYAAAGQRIMQLRDEHYRVVHHMADSVDNSAAALQRSGVSKSIDQISTEIVLHALAQEVTEFAVSVCEMVQTMRKDPTVVWTCKGMEDFKPSGVGSLTDIATILSMVTIPSPSFQRDVKGMMATRIMGDEVDEERLEEYRKELEKNVTDEESAPQPPMAEQSDVPDANDEETEQEEEGGKKKPSKESPIAVAAHVRGFPK